jgi:acyl-CoA synthetase (NDP forming)
MNTMTMTARVVEDVIELGAETATPIVVIGNSGSLNEEHYERLRAAGIPFYERAGIAMRAIAAFCRFGTGLADRAGEEPVDPAGPRLAGDLELPSDPAGIVGEADVKALLADRGIAVPESRLVSSPEEAFSAAGELGYPLVVKSASTKVVHKSDIGAVRTGIGDQAALEQAVLAVSAAVRAAVSGDSGFPVLVEQQAAAGHEVIVGIQNDRQLGPLVTVGPGGVLAELLRGAHASRLAPITRQSAHLMLEETPLGGLLRGFRGAPAADVEALVDVIVSLGALALELGDRLAELECNPVLVGTSGAVAVDALLRLAR